MIGLVLIIGTAAGLTESAPTDVAVLTTPPWLALDIGAATVALAAGWAARIVAPAATTGVLVAAVGVLLPSMAAWSWLPDQLRAVVLPAAPLTIAGLLQVAVSTKEPAAWRTNRSLQVVVALTVLSALALLVGVNPFADPTCVRTCADAPAVLGDMATTRSTLLAVGWSTILASAVASTWVFTVVIKPTGSRALPGALLVALLMLLVAGALGVPDRIDPILSPVLLAVAPTGFILVGASLWVLALRTWRTRVAVQMLATELDPAASLGRGRPAVRGVQVAIPSDPRGGGSGEPSRTWVGVPDYPHSPAHRGTARWLELSDDEGPAVRLLLDGRVDAAAAVAGITPAVWLTLRNAQLSAEVAARLSAVRASQRRIVAVGDAERRRIERDLHDGAQQRLVSVAFHLRVALVGADPRTATRLRAADAHLHDALTHLRGLAHGMFPRLLTDEGLDVALAELVAASDIPIALDVRLAGSLPDDVAMAAFVTVSAAVADGAGQPDAPGIRVSIDQQEHAVTVRVESVSARDAPARLRAAVDRVGAVGGVFRSDLTSAGLTVSAVMPCGS